MNRKQLLDGLKKSGYTGKADLNDIEAWLKEQNVVLEGDDGKAVDIKAAFAATKKVTLSFAADAGEEVEFAGSGAKSEDATEVVIEDNPMEKSAEALLKASRKAASEVVTQKAVGIRDPKREIDRKAYAQKIKNTAHLPVGDPNKAVFNDPDQAEYAGAYMRLAFHNLKGFVNYAQRANDLAIVGKASSETNNASAGVLVPPEFYANVLWLTEQYGVARKIANVQRFSKTDDWKRPRKTALLTMQYIGEGATITASDNTYDLITLNPRKYGGLMVVSNELMDDSAVSIADQFAQSVAEGQAIAEDAAYFVGDGTATYGGQVGLKTGLPAGAYLAAGATWAANTLTSATLAPGSVENVHPYMRNSWVMSRQAFYQVFGRLFNAGGGNKNIDLAVYSLANPGANGANASINGDPVYFSQALPTTTPSSGVPWAYYGNFQSATMLGVHTDLRIVSDPSPYFTSDQMAFRAISRFAVNIHGDGRGSTVGPIAALKTT